MNLNMWIYLLLFCYAGYIGFKEGRNKIAKTRAGIIPGCKPDKSNDYFFLVYHD